MEGAASEFTDINDGYLQIALLFQWENKQNVSGVVCFLSKCFS